MSELVERQAVIDILLEKGLITAAVYVSHMPATQPEPLTAAEQRIFLAAMGREEKFCKALGEIGNEYGVPYYDDMINIVREIERKVKGALWNE